MLQKGIVIGLIIFLFGLNINSIRITAYENIRFSNITIEDGLGQSTVENIYQDSRGYIWFGTNDGLNRFNGYTFKLYSNDQIDEYKIAGNYIITMNEDDKGNLWVGTTSGVSKINLYTNNIENYKTEQGLSNNNIRHIFITQNSTILLGTQNGLNIYNEKTNKFEEIFKEDINGEEVNSLDEDDEGNIWAGTSKSLIKINLKDTNLERYSSHNIECDFKIIKKILCDNEFIWIGTFNNGLYKFNKKTLKSEKINIENGNFLNNCIRALMRDEDDVLWIGTSYGLVKYFIESDTYKLYTNDKFSIYSIINNEVYDIIKDKNGLVWVGTYSGVSMFESENKIEHYTSEPSSDFILNDNVIHGIYEDDDGLIWIGTKNKGVNIIDRVNRKTYDFTHISLNQYLSNDSINDIQGYKEKIFIGTDNGLNIYDKYTKKLKVYNEENGLNSTKIRNLMYDDEGFLWVGTQKGFNILNLNTDEIINLNYILEDNNIVDRYSGSMFKDSEGIYWIGTFINSGLIKINPNTGEIKVYSEDENNNSISNNSIRTIEEDKNGDLWIGTSYGLNKFNKKTEKFVNYTNVEGLPNNNIYGILIDDSEKIWVSTNRGISRLDPINDTFYNLNIIDGLQSNEFNGTAYRKLKNGELVFGGINGLNIFNPTEIINKTSIFKVEFDEIMINGKKVSFAESYELKHNENTINIKFFISDYKNIKNIQYYYLIDELTDEWSIINTNEIVLSNLKSGTYTFKIKAKHNNGIFTDEAQVKLVIKPAFWMRKDCIIVFLASLAGIIIYIFKTKNDKMKLLDRRVEERTKELSKEMKKNDSLLNEIINLEKRKNLHLINLSHDLRTPLNVLSSIQQVLYTLNNGNGIEKEKLNHYIKVSNKNIERLLKLIDNLINMAKIEDGSYELNISSCDIIYLVEETALSLKDYVESNKIELIIDPEIEECTVECDANEIERCVVNLMNNAVKFTHGGGKILVSISEGEEEVTISVSDTGIGIAEENLDTIFDRFNQVKDSRKSKSGSGLGLTITKHIIELHNGKISVESEVNKGSRFNIVLPKKQPA